MPQIVTIHKLEEGRDNGKTRAEDRSTNRQDLCPFLCDFTQAPEFPSEAPWGSPCFLYFCKAPKEVCRPLPELRGTLCSGNSASASRELRSVESALCWLSGEAATNVTASLKGRQQRAPRWILTNWNITSLSHFWPNQKTSFLLQESFKKNF